MDTRLRPRLDAELIFTDRLIELQEAGCRIREHLKLRDPPAAKDSLTFSTICSVVPYTGTTRVQLPPPSRLTRRFTRIGQLCRQLQLGDLVLIQVCQTFPGKHVPLSSMTEKHRGNPSHPLLSTDDKGARNPESVPNRRQRHYPPRDLTKKNAQTTAANADSFSSCRPFLHARMKSRWTPPPRHETGDPPRMPFTGRPAYFAISTPPTAPRAFFTSP